MKRFTVQCSVKWKWSPGFHADVTLTTISVSPRGTNSQSTGSRTAVVPGITRHLQKSFVHALACHSNLSSIRWIYAQSQAGWFDVVADNYRHVDVRMDIMAHLHILGTSLCWLYRFRERQRTLLLKRCHLNLAGAEENLENVTRWCKRGTKTRWVWMKYRRLWNIRTLGKKNDLTVSSQRSLVNKTWGCECPALHITQHWHMHTHCLTADLLSLPLQGHSSCLIGCHTVIKRRWNVAMPTPVKAVDRTEEKVSCVWRLCILSTWQFIHSLLPDEVDEVPKTLLSECYLHLHTIIDCRRCSPVSVRMWVSVCIRFGHTWLSELFTKHEDPFNILWNKMCLSFCKTPARSTN